MAQQDITRQDAVASASEALRNHNTGDPGKFTHIIELADYIVGGDPYAIRLAKDARIEHDLANADKQPPTVGGFINESDLLRAMRDSAPDGVMIFGPEDLASGRVEETLRGLFRD